MERKVPSGRSRRFWKNQENGSRRW